MAVAIRLMRFGKRHYPTYRIVALDSRRKRDGAYIEKIGTYNPMVEPVALLIDQEKLAYWTKIGARVSEGVRKLLKNQNKTPKAVVDKPAAEKTPVVKATKKAKESK